MTTQSRPSANGSKGTGRIGWHADNSTHRDVQPSIQRAFGIRNIQPGSATADNYATLLPRPSPSQALFGQSRGPILSFANVMLSVRA